MAWPCAFEDGLMAERTRAEPGVTARENETVHYDGPSGGWGSVRGMSRIFGCRRVHGITSLQLNGARRQLALVRLEVQWQTGHQRTCVCVLCCELCGALACKQQHLHSRVVAARTCTGRRGYATLDACSTPAISRYATTSTVMCSLP